MCTSPIHLRENDSGVPFTPLFGSAFSTMPRQAQPSNGVVSALVTVSNTRGLHLRCAGELAKLATAFSSRISIRKGRHQVDAKSMLEIVTLSASPGSKLTVSANGPDAQSALDAVVSFFNNNLGEP